MGDPIENLKTVVVKPIVYGNVSRYLGKKREDDGRTHEWKAFLRPYSSNENLSSFIKNVQFKLHESYTEPLRVVSEPPYEITETGWGEFDIQIKINFLDPNEKPILINHLIKLFHVDQNIMLGHKSLIREIYDELVFVDPSPSFYSNLISNVNSRIPVQHSSDFVKIKEESLNSIQDLNSRIVSAIDEYKKELKNRKDLLDKLKTYFSESVLA